VDRLRLNDKRTGTALHLQLDYSGGPINILQVTDTHIGADPDARLAGVDTRESLGHVLTSAREHIAADLMLLTGDLADRGSVDAYRELERQLSSTGIAQAWLPGNHDDIANMRAIAAQRMATTVGIGPWGIILLNSQIPGEVGGELAESEFFRLEQFLRQPDYQHLLVCVHHQPLPIGCRWLDQQRIANGDRLLDILAGCDRVKALLWGHVHQEFAQQFKHLQLLASPSTCVQFAPGSDSFKVDQQPPGYRILQLGEDGALHTRVVRIAPELCAADYNCAGY
jgi:Icc protein